MKLFAHNSSFLMGKAETEYISLFNQIVYKHTMCAMLQQCYHKFMSYIHVLL